MFRLGAQRWYDGDAEITIADRGMGIYDSLKQKHAVTSKKMLQC